MENKPTVNKNDDEVFTNDTDGKEEITQINVPLDTSVCDFA